MKQLSCVGEHTGPAHQSSPCRNWIGVLFSSYFLQTVLFPSVCYLCGPHATPDFSQSDHGFKKSSVSMVLIPIHRSSPTPRPPPSRSPPPQHEVETQGPAGGALDLRATKHTAGQAPASSPRAVCHPVRLPQFGRPPGSGPPASLTSPFPLFLDRELGTLAQFGRLA